MTKKNDSLAVFETMTVAEGRKALAPYEKAARKYIGEIQQAARRGLDASYGLGETLTEVWGSGLAVTTVAVKERSVSEQGQRQAFNAWAEKSLGLSRAQVSRFRDVYNVTNALRQAKAIESGEYVTDSHIRQLGPVFKANGAEDTVKVFKAAVAAKGDGPLEAKHLAEARAEVAPPEERAQSERHMSLDGPLARIVEGIENTSAENISVDMATLAAAIDTLTVLKGNLEKLSENVIEAKAA